ncbi:MAG: ATP-dependent sacrificial sulfur transferase LarE [Desulfobacterales bacterium]|nr:ATP-dependent sacrificial sulfur transferase LarE [Desulfobacterales bacterium]
MMNKTLKEIEDRLSGFSSVAVAFSGGVDSTFLLAAAKRAKLKKLIAVHVACQFVPQKETEFAKQMARTIGVELLCLEVDIFKNEDVVSNSAQRCYHCKKEIFSLIKEKAKQEGIASLLHAVNLDDLADYRPGLKAAEELGFLAPLAEAGFTKDDIRRLSKEMGLETWDKPSQSCLATRIPYGKKILNDDLVRIDKAEAVLQDLGFDPVRVRCHGTLARIEVTADRAVMLFEEPVRQKISTLFKRIGFAYTSVDIDGYITGKMNDEIR